MRPFRRPLAVLAGSTAVALWLAACPALADPITYNLDQSVATGSLGGTVTTNGAIGVLATSDIIDWNLVLHGGNSTITLTHANSTGAIVGTSLTATPTQLLFNFSGSDRGKFAFQANNPGPSSGFHYVCFAANNTDCRVNAASVVPDAFNDPTAQYEPRSGNLVIGTAVGSGAGGGGSTGNPQLDELVASLEALGESRAAQLLLFQLQSYQLLGLNEQVSCGDCGGVGLGFGSFNVSAHGRHALNDDWTALGGVNYGQYRQQGADVDLNAGFAIALQYDPWSSMGRSRPYAEVGVSAAWQHTRYTRDYLTDVGPATGSGRTRNYDFSAFAEVGWVARLSPRDEGALYVIASRTWQWVSGYSEATGASNPFSAVMPRGRGMTDTLGVHMQYTHLFGRRLEAGLNGGVDRVFQRRSGLDAQIGGLDIAVGPRSSFLTGEVGARLGLRVTPGMTFDFVVNAVLAPTGIGSSVHGGVGARWAF